MKVRCTLAALLLSAVATAQALAHGFWIEPRYGRLEATFGHGPAVEAYPSENLVGAWGYDIDGRAIKIDIQRTDTHALLVPRTAPAVVVASLDAKFFRPENTSAKNIKNAIIVLREGARFDQIRDIRLLLVPEVDPLKVGAGNPLPIRAYIDGKPAAGVRLMSDYRGVGTVALSAGEESPTTDAEGRTRIVVRNPGLNVIAGFIAEEDASGNRGFLHTTLAFLGQPYEHD
ncbi:hypothetical protein AXK11_03660 [Cephaloticoccus primus]|uniref:Nickel ABC transporter substrate-binding protein n=1 Tax=Cephaloticoccus primus TaxID=1548207 RepID=A0A139SQ99_9BACT|nr:DUF4198 domain-containing protein [Cephaloticoccus primus]KXU36641.1 hypothetical protein AXK11_03660 [Cephaloticoccus primus]